MTDTPAKNSAPIPEAIIYNITVQVSAAIAQKWLPWMLTEHIPEIMATNCFVWYKVVRLLEIDETEGPTYAVQFGAESKADYNRYTDKYAAGLRKKSTDTWGNGFVAFRTVMQVVEGGAAG